MKPVESRLVAFLSVGEGWHNYHHAFPWDYRAAEFGCRYSLTTMLIDVLAYFGQVYDLRTTPYQMVKRCVYFGVIFLPALIATVMVKCVGLMISFKGI